MELRVLTPEKGKIVLNSIRTSKLLDRHHAPRKYWQDSKNQLSFLEKLKIKYHIKLPTDWSNVRKQDVISNGGASILRKYGSLFNALKAIYTGWLV